MGYLGVISGWRHVHTLKNQVFNDYLGFPSGSVVKNSPANSGDVGLISELERSLGEGNGNHSSTLAWKIPWTEEPGGLQSMGSQRVRHD